MNGLDVAVVVIIGLSIVLGVFKGFIRELFAVVGVIIAAVGGIALAPVVLETFGFEQTGVAFAVAAVLLFAVIAISLTILEYALKRVLDALYLGGFNRLLGGIFGLGRGIVITSLALTALVLVLDTDMPLLRESRAIRLEAPAIEWIGTRLPWEPARTSFEERWSRLDLDDTLEI